ncbi:MAG: hypothetical protein A3C93_05745 [Candidatus Lloydbacteria bacterium RIFCSPHIGHO2_02_FULL_54_17]|uniref:ABC transporter substrate-binding protein n=1 Tax=Candidatus Lloydbacteria bacterium RIFCSPHIGHO2_02_FULL_54_17 TaxID=1798664 RepID=A0A1G2DAY0_9BACT|nr:MAG: hypothetical protein A2762_03215 [Candidatus Lloydbacteria bacterium RIFCSPHIGHO2_01_FULL_54_11]OGZ10787.1 MAG: hypothetical protein A3C93_05745 [Candidatus Lloydbacteria bacterium RIFCSPHIGHO2_02_FULL_54_17]OGZ13088.1 MAG: hypothetical protein A2948_03725 [Candidatus Lloydbacteria bacterium RIFCSPLOWO2_01_FULL_54_18]OGZ16535.1 MAG: hypothetical protein A3H76_04585 [Candidatus Lloydbacteria bacterium RIFCSPLOWO2_02_FULL_54_12]
MRSFHSILLTFFGFMAVVAIGVFSFAPSRGDQKIIGASGNAVIWGTFDLTPAAQNVIVNFNAAYQKSFSVTYEYHDPENFDNDIVEALASGKGPDVLLLPDDLILRHIDKIELIPYTSFPPDVFQASFVQAAEIYMRDQGLVALPFVLDPMVMYWNRDMFNNASVIAPPRYWDELLLLAPKLTKRNPKTFEVTESAIAFGEYVNVEHAKDVLALLFLQVGNPIVALKNGKPRAMLMGGDESKLTPSEDVLSSLRFFMDFSNPQKSNFTWNRSRANSLNEFIDGNLAMHLDYASAYTRIKEKNPHLNFSVTQVPLLRETSAEITFTKIHGLAVMKSSKNKSTAFVVVQRLLTDADPAKDFAAAFDLPPVTRKPLAARPTDAALAAFYDAAIRGRTWLDPRPSLSDEAFRNMVESVSSGRSNISDAVNGLHHALNAMLRPYQQ